MITLARESRGLSQAELATKIEMSPANLSKIERGDIGVSQDIVELIATATHYPLSFFTQDDEMFPEHLIYRKREKVAQKILTPINAKVNIVRFHVQSVLEELKIKHPHVPSFEVDEKNTPMLAAQKLRKIWKVEPIINDLIQLLESKGIVITYFKFNTDRVDSRSVLTKEKYPIIIYNSSLLGDRQRFSIAYQLGHLAMHTSTDVSWDRDISHEANLFAAEFLMPEKEIRQDFDSGITVPLLGELKKKWKVSMISLLFRADDLGYLSPNQKRYLLQQFNEQKIRKREPVELDIPVEKPRLLRTWLSELKSKQKLSVASLASKLHLQTDEFIELYN
ncbi:hypothetical protein CAP35_07790 [Chitinophagaceae bacterium IBVUCB1]|nr:hypothetical protein CAP35_07790 [Chitinophagaceae bacterium IBVUCB1]